MSIERRGFLRTSSLGVAAGLLATSPGRVLDLAAAQDAGARRAGPALGSGDDDWDAVRARFAIDRSYVHMSGMYLASHPEPVAEAVEAFRERLDANPTLALRFNGEAAVRQAMVRYAAIPPDETALTTSTTMGLGIAIHGLRLRPGAEILHTTHDHRVMGSAIEYKAEHSGATIRRISLYEDDRPEGVSEAEVLERLRAGLRPETRLFGATWVHSKNGVKLPIAAMSRVVDEVNAGRAEEDHVVFVVDGVHGFGIEDVEIPALGCDFFAAGTHKWIFAPRGTGILWGNPRSHDRVTPVIPSMGPGTGWGGRMSPGGFQAFEHRWAMAEAFDFHREIGKDRIQARIHELNAALKEGLQGMAHVRLYTPMDPALSSGITCFDVEGVRQRDVVERLLDEHRIIATTTPYSPSHARLTPGLLSDHEEVEACLAAIRAMA
jgi:selenocysteine lyase/cysteine desulfurase